MKFFRHNRVRELSYFRILLEKYLFEHFPELLERNDFINTRVELAEETYCEARKSGKDVNIALEYSHEQLLGGLEFSQFDFLSELINGDFSDKIPEKERRDFCIRILPGSYPIFNKHQTLDDISGYTNSDKLKGKLAGYIESALQKDGIYSPL